MCNRPEPCEKTLKEDQPRIIPVKFGQNSISGLGGDVLFKKLFTDVRMEISWPVCLRNKSHLYGINPTEIH